jgi:hypothetical protein
MSGISPGVRPANGPISATSETTLTRRASFSTPVTGGASRPLRKSRAQSAANTVALVDNTSEQSITIANDERPRPTRRDTWVCLSSAHVLEANSKVWIDGLILIPRTCVSQAGNLIGSSSSRRLVKQASAERTIFTEVSTPFVHPV